MSHPSRREFLRTSLAVAAVGGIGGVDRYRDALASLVSGMR